MGVGQNIPFVDVTHEADAVFVGALKKVKPGEWPRTALFVEVVLRLTKQRSVARSFEKRVHEICCSIAASCATVLLLSGRGGSKLAFFLDLIRVWTGLSEDEFAPLLKRVDPKVGVVARPSIPALL